MCAVGGLGVAGRGGGGTHGVSDVGWTLCGGASTTSEGPHLARPISSHSQTAPVLVTTVMAAPGDVSLWMSQGRSGVPYGGGAQPQPCLCFLDQTLRTGRRYPGLQGPWASTWGLGLPRCPLRASPLAGEFERFIR